MLQVLKAVDKANGYCFGDMEERNLQAMMSAAVGADFQFDLYPFSCVTMIHSNSSCLETFNFRKVRNECWRKRDILIHMPLLIQYKHVTNEILEPPILYLLCYTNLIFFLLFLNNYKKRTLGVQERYVEASGKTVEQEMMEL